ncbi:hypothetical protein KC221_27330, partial [Mycobacterium tuberculosis]|nr:hypothetical protein [Mycobacterium tuberculosis]
LETVIGADGSATTFAPGRIFNSRVFPSGGAGMAGTAEDFLAFLEALRQGGAPVLGPAAMRLLTENAIGPFEAQQPGRGFSLGWS